MNRSYNFKPNKNKSNQKIDNNDFDDFYKIEKTEYQKNHIHKGNLSRITLI